MMRERILVIEKFGSVFDDLETPSDNPYLKLGKTFLAYVAGLIDGEGCIFIHRMKHKRKRRETFSLMVTIANTSWDLLSHLRLRLSGCIDKSNEQRGRERRSYRLRLNGNNAAMLLEAVYPYLVLKSSHARIASEFQRQIRLRKARKMAPLTPEEFYQMADFKRISTELNRRGT
jgi:hypothetical protein